MSSMLNPAISRSRIFELTSEEWALMFAAALLTVAGIAAISPSVTAWVGHRAWIQRPRGRPSLYDGAEVCRVSGLDRVGLLSPVDHRAVAGGGVSLENGRVSHDPPDR